MKVIVVGKLRGINRTETTIQCLKNLDGTKVYAVPQIKPRTFIFRKFFTIYSHIYYAWVLAFCRVDSLFYLAMNENYTWAICFAKRLGIRVIVDNYALRQDILISDRKIDTSLPTLKRIRWIEKIDRRRIYLASDLIFLSKTDIDHVTKKMGAFSAAAHVIPLSIPVKKRVERVNNKSGLCRVVWWGSLSSLHGIDYIIEEFKDITHENVELHLFDTSQTRALNLIDRYRLEGTNIQVHWDKTFSNGLHEWLSMYADIILGVFGDTTLTRSVFSNKCAEALQYDKPIITIESKVYQEFGMTKAFHMIDRKEGELTNAIENSLHSQARIDNSTFVAFFSPEKFAERLAEVVLSHDE